jgi:hypothetical protein
VEWCLSDMSRTTGTAYMQKVFRLPDRQKEIIITHTGVGLGEILLDFGESPERPKE